MIVLLLFILVAAEDECSYECSESAQIASCCDFQQRVQDDYNDVMRSFNDLDTKTCADPTSMLSFEKPRAGELMPRFGGWMYAVFLASYVLTVLVTHFVY